MRKKLRNSSSDSNHHLLDISDHTPSLLCTYIYSRLGHWNHLARGVLRSFVMSTSEVPFLWVDVFALPGKPFTGNQLAVVHSAQHLQTYQMQRIANRSLLSRKCRRRR